MHPSLLGRLFSGKNGLFKFSCEIDDVGPFDGIINFDDVFFGMLVSRVGHVFPKLGHARAR